MIFLLIQSFNWELSSENVIVSYVHKVFSKVSLQSYKIQKLSEYLLMDLKELNDELKIRKVMDDLSTASQNNSAAISMYLKTLFGSNSVDDINFVMKLYSIMLQKL